MHLLFASCMWMCLCIWLLMHTCAWGQRSTLVLFCKHFPLNLCDMVHHQTKCSPIQLVVWRVSYQERFHGLWPRIEITLCHRSCKWVLGTQIQVLTLKKQTFYQLCSLPSPALYIFLICWMYIENLIFIIFWVHICSGNRSTLFEWVFFLVLNSEHNSWRISKKAW